MMLSIFNVPSAGTGEIAQFRSACLASDFSNANDLERGHELSGIEIFVRERSASGGAYL
jgi:hypothetical protein